MFWKQTAKFHNSKSPNIQDLQNMMKMKTRENIRWDSGRKNEIITKYQSIEFG